MAAGSTLNILVCKEGPETVSPCGTGSAPAFVSAYILNTTEAANYENNAGPFDYASASIFWASSFTLTVLLYFTSRFIGEIVGMVRRDFG